MNLNECSVGAIYKCKSGVAFLYSDLTQFDNVITKSTGNCCFFRFKLVVCSRHPRAVGYLFADLKFDSSYRFKVHLVWFGKEVQKASKGGIISR